MPDESEAVISGSILPQPEKLEGGPLKRGSGGKPKSETDQLSRPRLDIHGHAAASSNISETFEASSVALKSAKQDVLDRSTSGMQDAKVESFSSGSGHPLALGHISNISKQKSIFHPFLSSDALRVPNWLNRTSFSTVFDNNVVSSVEGETVLIVENLNLCQPQRKDNGELSGTVVNSVINEPKIETDIDASSLVGKRIRKRFGRKYFVGDVIRYDREQNWYKVVYEDGDEEELDGKEVKRLLMLNEDASEDHSYEKRGHQRSGSNNVKRISKNGKEDVNRDVSEEGIRGRQFKGLRKSIVVDTSNDDSEIQHSASSNETLDSNDEADAEEHTFSLRKSKRRNRGKRRRIEDETENEKEHSGNHAKLGSRHKDDFHLKLPETPPEYQITTRRLTGSLSTNAVATDSITSEKLKDSLMQDSSIIALPSPLGGGLTLIGRKTQKDFGGELYFGEIIDYDDKAKYYKVRYEDGDEEELEWSELQPTLLPEGENVQVLSLRGASQTEPVLSRRKISHTKSRLGVINVYEGEEIYGDLPASARRWRKKIRTASVSIMAKGVDDWDVAVPASDSHLPPRPLAVARFASASDADAFEYFAWGEIVNFERFKCPELRATQLLPTSSPVVHLAVSRHHLAALTVAGQVWIWRCKHGNIHSRCNEWEHVSILDGKSIILVDISGPDVDRASAGYQAEQEDQVPDPFYMAAVCSNGADIILQGSQAHEYVHTKLYEHQNQYPSLQEAFFKSNPDSSEYVGNIVQLSVGMVEAADESPFVGYITDTDAVYIRSATRDYMEEVNVVAGYTGKPVKIQCGRVYHAIIMTDDGRAWTWGQGYYHGSNSISAGFPSKWASPFPHCEPAVGTLVGRKVIDVGCYGEDFIALTNDGEVHYWTHARPNPAAGVYNVPATAVDGQGPRIASGDKLKQVTIGAGVCAGITESGKVHTWRTSMKGGFVGIVGSEQEALTPLGHEESYKDTTIFPLATRVATKVVCVAGSLLVVVKRKMRGRRGWKRKSLKGEELHDEVTIG